jgi:hypothetical protein
MSDCLNCGKKDNKNFKPKGLKLSSGKITQGKRKSGTQDRKSTLAGKVTRSKK